MQLNLEWEDCIIIFNTRENDRKFISKEKISLQRGQNIKILKFFRMQICDCSIIVMLLYRNVET